MIYSVLVSDAQQSDPVTHIHISSHTADAVASCKIPILETQVQFPGGIGHVLPSLLVPMVKKICLQCGRPGFNPWIGKISWRREWQPTQVFLSGKSHGQRNLAGYSPRDCKESDTTERLTLSLSHIYSFFVRLSSHICYQSTE